MPMSPQLGAIAADLESARRRAHDLTDELDAERWGRRPRPASWSAAECLIHLNVTSEAFLPRLREAIERGRRDGITGEGPFRRDLAGWFLCWSLEPPARIKFKTPAAFAPASVLPKEEVLADFDRLQGELTALLAAADGLDLGRLRIASPFAERLSYNLVSAFRVIPTHQRRHLWQAERALAAGDPSDPPLRGMLHRYAKDGPVTPEEMREAAHQGAAEKYGPGRR